MGRPGTGMVRRLFADMWFENHTKRALAMREDVAARGDPNRHLMRPHVRTSEYQRGAKRKTVSLDLNEQLYQKFKEFVACHGGDLSVQGAFDAYIAWVLGMDCPDSPFVTDKGREELKAIEKNEANLPRYWRHPSPPGAGQPDDFIASA
jgi:hypothetical protein